MDERTIFKKERTVKILIILFMTFIVSIVSWACFDFSNVPKDNEKIRYTNCSEIIEKIQPYTYCMMIDKCNLSVTDLKELTKLEKSYKNKKCVEEDAPV